MTAQKPKSENGMIRLSFSNIRRIDITDCEWKDLQLAIRGGKYQYGCFDSASFTETEATKPEPQGEGPQRKFKGWVTFGCGKHLRNVNGGTAYDVDCLDCQKQPTVAWFEGETPAAPHPATLPGVEARHKHRCMRCDEEFECQSSGLCGAGYNVLPKVVKPDSTMAEHCPAVPDWEWIRAYGKRRALALTAKSEEK